MKKHFWRILTVLLMACLGMGVLAACGDGEEPENPPAPPAVANPYEGIWTGASATDFIMSGTQTVSAAVDFVEGQAHEGYVVATITGSGANAETYYAAFGIDKDGETYKGDLFFGDETVEVTLSLANNQLKAVVPSFEEGEDPTTLTFTSRNATLPAAISPTGTLYCGDDSAETIFTFDFTNKKFYVNEAQQVAKFVNVANYVVIETEQGEGEDAFTACLIVYQKGTAYHCNGMGDDMELSTTKPVPAPTTYSVTFEAGTTEGTGTLPAEPNKYESGQTYTLPDLTSYTWTGHTFEGWLADTDQETYDAGETYTFTDSDVTFTAQWSSSTPTPTTYTVEFSAGDHGTLANGDPVPGREAGNSVTLPTVTPSTGYTFDGWYKDGTKVAEHDATTYSVNAEHAVSGTITLTAHYTAIKYTVKFDANGGTGTIDPVQNVTVEAGSNTVTLSDKSGITRTGYNLTGWTLNNADVGDTFTLTEQNVPAGTEDGTEITLTAKWTAKTYTLTFDDSKPADASDKDITGDSRDNKQVTLDSPDVALPTIALEGYIFKGWKLNGDNGAAMTSFTLTAQRIEALLVGDGTTFSFTAEWEKKEADKFSVTFEDGEVGGATVTGKPGTVQVEAGSYTIPDEEPECEGYTFTGWKVLTDSDSKIYKKDGEGTEQSYDVSKDVTFTAQWTKSKYSVTYNYGNGTEQTKDTEEIEWGTDVILETPTAKPGYEFKGWEVKQGADSIPLTEDGQNKKFTMPKAAVTVTATWTAKTYTITLTVEKPEGYKLSGEITGDYEDHLTQTVSLESTEITLPTLSLVGYTFGGWLKGGEAFTATTFTADMIPAEGDTIELTAKWDVISYTITFAEGKPEGAGDVTGMPGEAKTVTAESIEATLETPELNGYTFVGWKLDGTHTFTGNFTLTSELIGALQSETTFALTATWTKDDVLYTFNFYENKDDEEAKTTATETLADGAHVGSETVEMTISKKNYTFDGWYYEKNGEEHVFDTSFVPSDYGSTTIKVYAKWTLNDEITVDDITTTGDTLNTPTYVYPEKLKAGETLTLTSNNMTFSGDTTTFVEWRGINFYITDGEPVEGAISANWVKILYNNVIKGEGETALNFRISNELGFPNTDYWWVESLQEIVKTGKNISLKAVIDFSTKTRIMVEYTVTATVKPWHSDGQDHAGPAQYETEEEVNFVTRYYITPITGNALADEYTIAIGGEQAKVTEATFKRTTHTHDYVDDLWCECGELNPEHEHSFENGVCAGCHYVCTHTFTEADGDCSVCGQYTGKQVFSEELGSNTNGWFEHSKTYTMTKPEEGKTLEVVYSARFKKNEVLADYTGVVTRFNDAGIEQAFLQGNCFSLENEKKAWGTGANTDRTIAAYGTACKAGFFCRVIVRWTGNNVSVLYELWTAEDDITGGPDKTGAVTFTGVATKGTYDVLFGLDGVESENAKLVVTEYSAKA